MKRSPTTRDRVMHYVKQHPNCASHELVTILSLSRQRVAQILTQLVADGKITRTGATKNARYQVATASEQKIVPQLFLAKELRNLQEDKVFDEIDLKLRLKKHLPENVYQIVYYAFTEMLNNAIDHSGSKKALITFETATDQVRFSIRDFGVGAFKNVQKKFKLASEFEGLEHLLKGKQTTRPEEHSGQGIFFTSRIADRFMMRSHRLDFIVDNKKDEIFAGERRNQSGTAVTFEIKRRSKKILKSVFDSYSSKDYEFDRADLRVRLTADHELLSRSQAKRILAGMDKYRKLVFDFAKVSVIGQAFADEIFRVFQKRNPQMEITFSNANEAVTGMILRAIREK